MSLRTSSVALAGGLFMLGTGTVLAQSNWVDFQDETNTRLQISVVNQNTDNEEKDLEPGDFNNDGWTDLVIVRKTPFTNPGPRVNVLLMNENGILVDRSEQYAPGFNVPDDTRDLIAFDANNDGWLDLVSATTFFEQPRLWMNRGDDGNGNWLGFDLRSNSEWMTSPFSPAPKFCSVVAGDVNNDGWDDLFFSDYENSLRDRILINNGNETFTDQTNSRITSGLNDSTFGTQGHIEDFNGDGYAEIIATSGSFDEPDMLRNTGAANPGFFPSGQTFSTGAAYQSGVGDFDNDDDMDLYICDDGQDYVFWNNSVNANGSVNFSSSGVISSFLTQGFNHHNHAYDVDRDGYLDQGTADVDVDIPGCSGQFALLRNRLSVGTQRGFYDPNNTNHQPWNVSGTYDFAWIDVNNDGCIDLVHGRCTGYKLFIQTSCDVVQETGTKFCFGDGGDQMGCTNCPCGNNAPQGTQGGCLNESGGSGVLEGANGASVSSNQLAFTMTGGNPNTFAMLVSANNQLPNQGVCPPGSGIQGTPPLDGLRCVGGGLLRHGVRPMDAGGDVGISNNDWSNSIAAGFSSGQVRQFQVFYRADDQNACQTGQNTSNAVSVTFTP